MAKMSELEIARLNIPYYRKKGGFAYKQHMAHIRNLEKKERKARMQQSNQRK